MNSALDQVLFSEGVAIYQEIARRTARWEREIRDLKDRRAGTTDRERAVPGSRRRVTAPLHSYYPFLFHTCFPDVPVEVVRKLSAADRLYTEHLLACDLALDRPQPGDPTDLFLAHLKCMHSLKYLYELFPPRHPFWEYFHACRLQTWRAVREEHYTHWLRIRAYPLQRFCALARGKAAVLKPFSMALAFYSGRTARLEGLAASLDHHHTGLVLLDDLEDWRQDLRRGHFTFLLTRLLQTTNLSDRVRAGQPVSADRAGRLLYGTGLADDQLRLAESFFCRAARVPHGLPLPVWQAFNQGFASRCRLLRQDLAEIRRRQVQGLRSRRAGPLLARQGPGARTPRPDLLARISQGLDLLASRIDPEGSFRIGRSPSAYLRPFEPLGPSRAATTLIVRALEPMAGLDPRVPGLVERATAWLEATARSPITQGLPTRLEHAFAHVPVDRRALADLDRSFLPGCRSLPDGLFWANLLAVAARASIELPRLAAFVSDCVTKRLYAPWSDGASIGPADASWARERSAPFLAILLFCQGLGSGLPRSELQQELLAACSGPAPWGAPTHASLTLICLFLTGYDGPELGPAIQDLAERQEPSGGWPPNAVFQQGNTFYGCAELTTAWCIEALFRYATRTRALTPAIGVPGPSDKKRSSRPADPVVHVHPGTPGPARLHVREAFRAIRARLGPLAPSELYLGRWPGMPGHFVLASGQKLRPAVNLAPDEDRTRSRRPALRIETTLALMLAARLYARGPLKDLWEHLLVAGLSLRTAKRLWPGEPTWMQAGTRPLNWLWCRAHEGFLWREFSGLRRTFRHPSCPFHWVADETDLGSDPGIPEGALQYLGLRLSGLMAAHGLGRDVASQIRAHPGALHTALFRGA